MLASEDGATEDQASQRHVILTSLHHYEHKATV